jgi:hypothetical protein
MELDQAPTSELISRVVKEQGAKKMAKVTATLCSQANLQSGKKVRFESKDRSHKSKGS